ncbi:hypothetical protein GCM10010116_15670 [Microbispora rosea subsp. aerata]|nr:restriction endonuclease subunit S [Microbispora rosea]GGO07774.1 hypothetical protein GCM10010116_15670 [Microbispora rosea subsp. aerata]GIH53266.1 hypothetical protein Mro02_01800 [Microbispora rosea subsp. aerata]GLJ83821.1 hypothetical protein GCM10017588_25490 [Microbispora rosea subsp. aerata]
MRDLPRGWSLRRLVDVVELPKGQVDPRRKPYSGQPLIAPDHIESRTGRILQVQTAAQQGASSGKYVIQPGDVVYSKIRPALRKAALSTFCGLCSADMYPLRPTEEIESRYLLAVLLSEDFSKFAEGVSGRSGIPKINRGELKEYSLALPSKAEQRRIAEILDTLDSQLLTIDLVLEKLRRFSQGLVESLLSNVSAEELSLGKFLAGPPKNGYSPKEIDQWTGFLVLGLGCLTRDGFAPRRLKNIQKSDFAGSAAVLQDGDLLISRANTRDLVGLAGRYRDVGHPCIYPDLMMRLTPNQRCRSDFLELVLRSASSRRQIQALAQGTSESMVKISGSTLTKLLVRIPDLSEQERILRVSSTVEKNIRNEQRKREKLLLLKRGLMEDLLTGRVRVPEAEAVLERL